MVFLSLREMRVMSKAVSICNRTEWLISFTDIFGWTWCWEKGCHQTVFLSCLLCDHVCYFMHKQGCRIPLYVFAFCTHDSSGSWMDIEMPGINIQVSRWRLFMSFLNGVDCWSCCSYWLLYCVLIILKVHQLLTVHSNLL